jgi:hypothetical protein
MRRRYLVADQNYLRAPELEALLCTDPSVRIVLPDLGFFEMAKNDHKELTVRLSLRTLARYPRRVNVARAIGQALRQEIDTKTAVAGLLAPSESTKVVREVLVCLAADLETTAVKRLLNQTPEHADWLKRTFLDHDDNKARALSLVEAVKIEAEAAFAKKVRSGPANLNSAISGNSGHEAGPRKAWREGVFDGQEVSAPYPAHP